MYINLDLKVKIFSISPQYAGADREKQTENIQKMKILQGHKHLIIWSTASHRKLSQYVKCIRLENTDLNPETYFIYSQKDTTLLYTERDHTTLQLRLTRSFS